jgi:ELWxxDGT repeat protein
VGGTLFFTTRSSGLWKSDGTEAGTVLVKAIAPSSLTDVGGVLFFIGNDGINGEELWKSDGTEAGTVLVKAINAGSGSSSPTSLTNVGGVLFFSANDGINGRELWKSDGTAAGTVLVADIANPGGSSPGNLTDVNGRLFFSATDDTHGQELWFLDPALRMYRAYNRGADFHFFTTSRAQFDNAVRAGYRDETTGNSGFTVYPRAVTDERGTAIPIYRLYHLARGFHYYTLDANERASILMQQSAPGVLGWRDEGIEGYMYAAPAGSTAPVGTTLVHRLYNNNSGVHLFTQDVNVRTSILAAFPGVWVEHDPVGFAFAVNASGQAAARRAQALAVVESRDESREMRGNLAATFSSLSTLDSQLYTPHSTSVWVGPAASSRNGDLPPARSRASVDVLSDSSNPVRRFGTDRHRGTHPLDSRLLDRVWSDFGDEFVSWMP